MSHGYQLETSSLWDNPILRKQKDNTEVRADANRGTIEALQKSGLIGVAKDGRVLNPTVWRLTKRILTGTLRRAGSILTGVGRPTAGA
jgi:hypothetical protein